MALLTNINGKFSVSDAGAVTFNNAFTFPTTDGTANYVLKTNGSGTVSWSPDSSPTVYWAANGNDIYNTNSANVGIGITFATAKLQIHNTNAGAAAVAAFLVNASTSLNTETRLAFAANTNDDIATGRYSYISTINTSGSNGQAMTFATNETGASAVERMRIDSSGNVGIGITAPASKLHVYKNGLSAVIGKISDANIFIDSGDYGNSTYNAQIAFGYYSNVHTYAPVAIGFIPTSGASQGKGDLTFNTRSGITDIAPTERMRITSAGRVTIKNKPNSSLAYDVLISVGTGADGDVGYQSVDDLAVNIGASTSSNWVKSGNDIYNTNSGGVGIGTSVTTGGFNVNNSTAGSYYNMSNVDSGNYKYTNPGGRLLTSNATGWFADGRDPILTLSSSGNSENSAIGNSIGLNLYTNSYTYGNFSPLITFSALSDSGSYASAYAAIAGRKTNRGPDTNWNTGDLCFWTTGPEASNPASYMQQTPTMVIKSGGNVGIGTNSPVSTWTSTFDPNTGNDTFKLTSEGWIVTPYLTGLAAYYPGQGARPIFWSDVNGTNIQSWDNDAADAISLRSSNGSIKLIVKEGGNVGIGTTSPGYKLHVQSNSSSISAAFFRPNVIGSGDAAEPTTVYIDGQKAAALDINRFYSHGTILNIRQNNSNVGSISVTGVATAYNTSSDYRLKEDLQDFNGLDKVSKIPVYDFKWKSDESRSYGVMAHELQEVLPDAVSGDKDAEEMQGVDYSKIVPLLVKSIQELKAEIEILKNK